MNAGLSAVFAEGLEGISAFEPQAEDFFTDAQPEISHNA